MPTRWPGSTTNRTGLSEPWGWGGGLDCSVTNPSLTVLHCKGASQIGDNSIFSQSPEMLEREEEAEPWKITKADVNCA